MNRQRNDFIARRLRPWPFLYRLHKQNLYYFLWHRFYLLLRECYGIYRCAPLDAAMHRRFALYVYAYMGNPYAFKAVYRDWKPDGSDYKVPDG